MHEPDANRQRSQVARTDSPKRAIVVTLVAVLALWLGNGCTPAGESAAEGEARPAATPAAETAPAVSPAETKASDVSAADEPPVSTAPPVRVSGRFLLRKATRKPQPPYPSMSRAQGIDGTIVVEVTVDERGNVVAARAISGNALLRDGAVGAARGWKFSPTLISGVPVKVIGPITFNFRKS